MKLGVKIGVKTIWDAHLLLLIYLTISTLAVCFLDKTAAVVVYSQILLFVTFFWVVWAQIKLNGIVHLFTIFLGIFFVYLLGLPFYDLLGWVAIGKSCLGVPVKLSNPTLVTVYTYTSFFLMVMFLGILLGNKNRKAEQKVRVTYNRFLYQVGLVFFLYALPGAIIKYYLRFQLFLAKGYSAGYDGSVDTINFPIICFGASAILVLGYCFILASNPSKRKFLIISCIFLLTQALNAAKGQRMGIMLPLIFVFWYYMKLYVKKISIKKMLIFVLCLIVLSQAMLFLRGDRATFRFSDAISSFFVEQGGTFLLLPNQIELSEHIKNTSYPYILNPLVPHGKNTFSDKYMQHLNPEHYKRGGGIGDSIVLQLYELPHVIGAIICFLLGFMIVRFEIFLTSRRFLLFSSYYFVYAVLTVRYDLLGTFYTWLGSAAIWVIVKIVAHKNIKDRSKALELKT